MVSPLGAVPYIWFYGPSRDSERDGLIHVSMPGWVSPLFLLVDHCWIRVSNVTWWILRFSTWVTLNFLTWAILSFSSSATFCFRTWGTWLGLVVCRRDAFLIPLQALAQLPETVETKRMMQIFAERYTINSWPNIQYRYQPGPNGS